jgi:hypothetical protein
LYTPRTDEPSLQVPIRVARFFFIQNTKPRKNIPNYHELYQ